MADATQISTLIRSHPLFESLDEAAIAGLSASASVNGLPAGHILFEQGDRPDRLHILRSGTIELCAPSGSGETCLAILCRGDVFMLAPVLAEQAYLVSARTSSRVALLVIDAVAFRAEAGANLELCRRTAILVASKFRSLQRMLIEERIRSAPQRLGALLIRTADRQGSDGFVDLPVPKRTLAARLGISAESVSRGLKQLEQHGLATRGSRAFLADRPSLESFCAMDALIDAPDRDLLNHTL